MNKIVAPLMVALSALVSTQVQAEDLLVNDFNDGTLQGWHKGGAAATPLTAESEADGNGYLKFVSNGPESEDDDKNITMMGGNAWRGNYNAMGAQSVKARIKVIDAPHDLEMHVAFGNTLADLRTRFSSSGVMVPADGEWHEVTFSLTEGLHQVSVGGHGKSSALFALSETLGNVAAIRFIQGKLGEVYFDRRGPFEGYNAAEKLKAEVWFDDIRLSTDEAPVGIVFDGTIEASTDHGH